MTSAFATALRVSEYADALRKTAGRDKKYRVYVVGDAGLVDELREVDKGIEILETVTNLNEVNAVVVGIDHSISYEKIASAQLAIKQGGAKFIATNQDAAFPGLDEAGHQREWPGAGSIVAAVHVAAGVDPETIGKPDQRALEILMKRHGVGAQETLMVGDNPSTDILAGRNAGAHTVLLRGGLAKESPRINEVSADHVLDTIACLLDHYCFLPAR